jgi:hypothetical protein
MTSFRSIAVTFTAACVAVLGLFMGVHDSAAEWPAKWANAEMNRHAEKLPDVDFVTSDNGEHVWLIRDGKSFVGLHNDRCGTWIDLRSSKAKGFPEFAICVPKDGGAPFLQVCDTNGEPITVNLVKAVRLLKKLSEEED